MVDLQTKKVKQETEVIPGLVRQARRTLVSVSSHKFPFDLFPDSIRVEEDKVTVITRKFIWSSEVHGVDVKDIVNVFINTSPSKLWIRVLVEWWRRREFGQLALRRSSLAPSRQ